MGSRKDLMHHTGYSVQGAIAGSIGRISNGIKSRHSPCSAKNATGLPRSWRRRDEHILGDGRNRD